MPVINFEFKAIANNIDLLERKLLELNPYFKGEDHQADIYFNTTNGRLKLRQGNIENALIWYEREDAADAKQSNVLLYEHAPDNSLMEILTKTLGIKAVVNKIRRIYFIENVKFHFDRVKDLGTFVEVEAIDTDGNIGIDTLKRQCFTYAGLFELQPHNYIGTSYSDMILAAQGSKKYK